MSSLYKLSIKGIRAFEPEQEETIQFGFPLTLICGQNGCGKTTIIECLKYATTGDLPPNSKGGAFVNDPTISGRGNVTGQVKLAFRNANGKSMIITRTVQLTRKKARNGAVTNTFKSLEGQLLIVQGGEKVSISSKNAELDAQTPIYLGASRAVLDFVLFCHQDDSLWPLSEASVLKKRFDDIFEASKYTKVLDNLKVIRKDMAVNIKLMEQGVDHLKIDKERAEKVKARLQGLYSKAEQYTSDLESITVEIDGYEREANDLFSLNQDFQATLVQHDRLLHEQKLKFEQVERLRSSIEILSDLYEVLIEKQENFDKYTQERESELNATKAKMSSLEETASRNLDDHNTLLRLEGSLKAREVENAANLKKMDEFIAQYSSTIGVSNPTHIQFSTAFNEYHEKLIAEVAQLDLSFTEEKKERQLVIQSKADAITRTQQNLNNQNQTLDQDTKKLADLKKKLLLADNTGGEIEFKRNQLNESENKLKLQKENGQIQKLQAEKTELEHELTALDEKSDDLAQELVTSTEHAGLIANIQSKEQLVCAKGMALKNLVDSIMSDYKGAVGSSIKVDSCEQVLNDAIASSTSLMHQLQEQSMQLTMKMSSVKSTIEANTVKTKQLQARMDLCLSEIIKVLERDEIETYDQVLADLEESSRNVAEDINTFEVTKQFNLTAIKTAETLGHCLMCRRPFEGTMVQTFLRELKASTKEDRFFEIEKQAKQIDEELKAVRAIGPRITEYREAKKTVGELSESTTELNAELLLLKADSNEKSNQLTGARAKCDLVDSLRKPVGDISRIQREISATQADLNQLRQEIEYYGTTMASAAELQQQQQALVAKIKVTRRKLAETDKSIASCEKTQSVETIKIKDARLEISKLEQLASDVGTLRASISEIETSIKRISTTIEVLQHELEILKSEKSDLQAEYDTFASEKQQAVDSKREDVRKTEQTLQKLETLGSDLFRFEEYTLPQLEDNSADIKRSLASKKELNDQIQQCSQQVRLIEQELNTASQTRHNIMANLDYRALNDQLSEIEEKLLELDIDGAQIRKEQYQESSRKLRDKIASLNAAHAGKTGELKQIRDQVKSLQAELDTDFKNVGSHYHEEWVKLQTNMLVSNDISTYQQALDNAIMKFHSLKMASINRILGELWSLTYKGTDIESIAIKSDYSVQTKGNRSYNYRVVMYKSGNELDMRGRCSAGQKVLTSILIRLALAECFGVNCGMIALDEPTTNLDQENAESLAEALNQIIEVRKQQQNFQLIVITHDENFLMHMNGDKFADHFYRVMRDDLQSSRIYSLPIHKIHEA